MDKVLVYVLAVWLVIMVVLAFVTVARYRQDPESNYYTDDLQSYVSWSERTSTRGTP